MVSSPLRKSAQCLMENLAPATVDIIPGATFHKIVAVIGSICAVLALIISTGHILHHAFNCYRVSEQKYLMRIAWVIPAFAIFYLFPLFDYNALQYVVTIPEIIEAVAFVSLFQLLVEQAAGTADRNEQDVYFAGLERHKHKPLWQYVWFRGNNGEGEAKHALGSLRWYRGICICLYQFPVTKLIWTPFYILLTGVFCPTNLAGKAVHVLNSIINFATTSLALWSLIIFYVRLRPVLKPRHAVRKAFVLKKMVGVVLFQSMIMSFVISGGGIHPTPQISYGDFTVGVMALIVQVEFFLFAIAFIFCYNVKEYEQIAREDQVGRMDRQPMIEQEGKVSPATALLAMINLSDFFGNTRRSAKHLFSWKSKMYLPEGGMRKFSSSTSISADTIPLRTDAAAPSVYPPHEQPIYSGPVSYSAQYPTQAPTPTSQPAAAAQELPGSRPVAYTAYNGSSFPSGQ